MKKIFFSIAIFFSLAMGSNAQNTFPAAGSVGIGTVAPNGSSLLEVKSTTKGLLIPRMTQAQRNAIAAPATGLLIFQTDVLPTFYWYTGAIWKSVGGAGRDLANLTGTTAINSSLLPSASGAIDLGSTTKKWRDGNFAETVTAGSTSVSTGVSGTGGTYGVYGTSTNGYGIFGTSGYIGAYGRGTSYGTYGYSVSGNGVYGSTSTGYGVYGNGGTRGVYGVGTSYGVYGSGGPYGVYGTGTSYGIWGTGDFIAVYGNGDDYGTYGYSSTGRGAAGYSATGVGVYGSTSGANAYAGYFISSSYRGIYVQSNASYYAGYFSGDVFSTGSYLPSDITLKKNVSDVSDAMGIINRLKPRNYEYKTDGNYALMNLPKGNHYGLIAQDLEKILPNLVRETDQELNGPAVDGKDPLQATEQKQAKEKMSFKAINYTELIPVLVKALQEVNEDKNKQIADLQSQINDLKTLLLKNGNGLASSADGYLKQNVPNPASNNNTVISYYLPENTVRAQIRITDAKGSLIKVYNATRGEGQLSIRSGELPAGTYNYSLYAGNKQIDLKQMVITR